MELQVQKIKQGENTMYSGKITFNQINHIVDTDGIGLKIGIKKYVKEEKVNNIYKNLVNDTFLSTTPVVIGLPTVIDGKDIEITNSQIVIPDNILNVGLLVDGHHRYFGCRRYVEKYGDCSVEFPVIFLTDYDKYELSDIFDNINYRQHNADYSMRYDIFGTLTSRNVSEPKVMHHIVNDLNNDENSPLKGLIKNYSNNNGIISQFHFTNKIASLFVSLESVKELKKLYRDIETYGIKRGIEYTEPYKELRRKFINYFQVLNEYINYSKNTNFDVLIKLIKQFFVNGYDLEDKEEIRERLNRLGSETITQLETIETTQKDNRSFYFDISEELFYKNAIRTFKKLLFEKYQYQDKFSLKEVYINFFNELDKQFVNNDKSYNDNTEIKILFLIHKLNKEGYIKMEGKGMYKFIGKQEKET